MNFRLTQHDRITVEGVEFAVKDKVGDVNVLTRVDDPLRVEMIDDATLEVAMRDDPSFRIDLGRDDPTRILVEARTGVANLWNIPLEHQNECHFRADFCRRFIEGEATKFYRRSDRSMKKAIGQIYGTMCEDAESPEGERKGTAATKFEMRKRPGAKTLRRWLSRFEAGGCSPHALYDCRHNRSGNHACRFDPEVARLMTVHATKYASLEKPTRHVLYEGLLVDIADLNTKRARFGMAPLPVPSRYAFSRRIARLDKFFVTAGREGRKAAAEKFRICHEGVDAARPLQRVEMDCWKAHLKNLLVKAGIWNSIPLSQREEFTKRFTVCVAEDAATRIILGLTLSPSASAVAAMTTLEMVTIDKGSFATATGALTPWDMRGSPCLIVTDRGSEFASDAFRTAVAGLRCDLMFPPAGTPGMRGRIEKAFATFGSQALSYFPGQTFSNPAACGDYPSAERACLDPDEFARVLVRYVVDIYHNTPHEGLGGETPRQAWLRLTERYGVVPPPDRHVRRALFGVPLERVVGPYGVRFAGLFYQHPDLHSVERLRKGKAVVDVRVDLRDLGRVSVRIGEDWRVATCRSPGMDNVSLDEWQRTVADLKETYAKDQVVARTVVSKAVADLKGIAAAARASVRLPDDVPTAEEIDRLEADLFAHLPRIDWDDETRSTTVPSDPFSEAISPATVDVTAATSGFVDPRHGGVVRTED